MARSQWKPTTGKCAVCRRRGRIVFHHLITRRHVLNAGGDVWDFRNAMPVGVYCPCHAAHHRPGVRDTRISLALVPADALAFAVDLLGADRAEDYFNRYYAT